MYYVPQGARPVGLLKKHSVTYETSAARTEYLYSIREIQWTKRLWEKE